MGTAPDIISLSNYIFHNALDSIAGIVKGNNELLCRGYSVDVGVVELAENLNGKIHRKQCEIDFVVNQGAKRYYIQSALNVDDASKMETELRPLKGTKDFFKKIIVTKTSAKPWIDDAGITHIGLYEFLLNEHSLEL